MSALAGQFWEFPPKQMCGSHQRPSYCEDPGQGGLQVFQLVSSVVPSVFSYSLRALLLHTEQQAGIPYRLKSFSSSLGTCSLSQVFELSVKSVTWSLRLCDCLKHQESVLALLVAKHCSCVLDRGPAHINKRHLSESRDTRQTNGLSGNIKHVMKSP